MGRQWNSQNPSQPNPGLRADESPCNLVLILTLSLIFYNRPWYSYVDPAASISLLERLTEEFIKIFDNCPSRLRKKIMASTEAVSY